MLAESSVALPFDVAAERTLFYDNDMQGVEVLRPRLLEAVRLAVSDKEPDNPVYRAAQAKVMREVVKDDVQRYLIDRLDRIEALMQRPQFGGLGQRPNNRGMRSLHAIKLTPHGVNLEILHKVVDEFDRRPWALIPRITKDKK